MRALLIVALIVAAAVAGYTYFQRASAPDESAVNGGAAPQTSDAFEAGYWAAPLPPGYTEVKDIQPEFEVTVTPERSGARNVLRVTVRERHGLLADGLQVKFTHLIKDETNGELVPDPKSKAPLVYMVRKRLEAGGVLEDDTTLTNLEMEELSDGNIGAPENWKGEVVVWARLARKTG